MTSPFEPWLAQLKAMQKGPVTFYARRGVVFSQDIIFPGDRTGTVIRGEVRASPDAAGDPLAEFNVSAPVVAGDQSLFNVALAIEDVDALPADTGAEGYVPLIYDLLIERPEDIERLLFGGLFHVVGRSTGV